VSTALGHICTVLSAGAARVARPTPRELLELTTQRRSLDLSDLFPAG
jgi:hypothetical protein